MQSTQQLQYDEFLELKTDFVTVVEALSVLHDFIESVFGEHSTSSFKKKLASLSLLLLNFY